MNIEDFKTLKDHYNTIKDKENGFFDLPKQDICMDREHNPPAYIVIPQGRGYKHVCPTCGKVSIVIPPQITL